MSESSSEIGRQERSVEEEGIGDIVVTARRREERLQQVPVSVTALGGEELATAGVEDVRRLTVAVPGFTGGRNFGFLQPTIRGIGSAGVSPGDEANVALYIDGVYQPNPFSNIGDFVEVERVEVLRGPQGTLFGRNATGGLVNIITPDPSFVPRGRVMASYSRFGGANAASVKGYVTGPLTDKLAGDLAVSYRGNDGFIDEIARGGRLGDARVISGRGKLLFQPSQGATIVLALSAVSQSDNAGNSPHPYRGNTIGNTVPGTIRADRPYQSALSAEPVIDMEAFTASLRTSFDLGGVTLATTTGLLKDHLVQISDNDGSPVPSVLSRVTIRNKALSQEVRLMSDGGSPFEWIVGGYAYHLKGNAVSNPCQSAAPFTVVRCDFSIVTPRSVVASFAGFGEGTYAFADFFKLTLGARYTTERRTFETFVNGAPLFTKAENTANRLTYRATAQFVLSDRANVFATYSTGFKSGIFNAFTTSNRPLRPEVIKSVEFGIKSDPAPWLRANVSVFHYDYTDLQLTGRDPGGVSYLQFNAAAATLKGGEMEIIVKPTPSLVIRATGTLLDARYDSFPTAQIFTPLPTGGNAISSADVAGNDLVRAPRSTLMLAADWSRPVGGGNELSIGANLFHSARYYYDYSERLSQPPYTMLNGEIALTTGDGKWRFSIFGRNLTDARVTQQISPYVGADLVTYERPLEAGIAIQIKL